MAKKEVKKLSLQAQITEIEGEQEHAFAMPSDFRT